VRTAGLLVERLRFCRVATGSGLVAEVRVEDGADSEPVEQDVGPLDVDRQLDDPARTLDSLRPALADQIEEAAVVHRLGHPAVPALLGDPTGLVEQHSPSVDVAEPLARHTQLRDRALVDRQRLARGIERERPFHQLVRDAAA
jgi:hypothetical protein